jgi:hypothetical protein
MRVVGMDVHVRNSFLCVTDPDGQLLKRGRVGNSLSQIAEFLGALPGGDQPLKVVLESTTNSRAIQRMMLDYGKGAGVEVQAQVLDARKLRVIAESVSKCDKLDAAVLNELARSNLKLPGCYIPDDDMFALREHLRARSDLVRMRTMLKNRVHSILHRRGILNPLKDLFTKDGRKWLGEMKLDEAGRLILDGYLDTLDQLTETIDNSAAALTKLSRTQRWCKQVAPAADDAGHRTDHVADDPGGAGRLQPLQEPRGSEQLRGHSAGGAIKQRKEFQRSHHAPRPRASSVGVSGGGVDGERARAAVRSNLFKSQCQARQAGGDRGRRAAHSGGRMDHAEER